MVNSINFLDAAVAGAFKAANTWISVHRQKFDVIRILVVSIGLAWGPAALATDAVPASSAQALYEQGMTRFASGHFQEAVKELQQAVHLAPESARYHDALGRAYGRVAQEASWFHAISLAVKTRKEFEAAVRLDGSDVDALRDLMQYYRQAPGILGGSDRKADALQQRLNALLSTHATASINNEQSSH